MSATRRSLADYLTALKLGNLDDCARPFDTQSKDLIEFGEQAEALALPEWSLEQIIPPDSLMIEKIYTALKPVLKELQQNTAFDREAEYGGLTADALAKTYLLCAINRKTVKNDGTLVARDRLAYQEFLRHCSDALVDNIPSQLALEHFSRQSEVQASFNSIIQNMTLSYPDKQALLTHYQSMQLFSMAYKTSLFDDQDLEQALSSQVKDSIRASFVLVYGKKSDGNLSDLCNLLNQLHVILEYALNHHRKDVWITLLTTLRIAPFFMKSIPELSDTADTTCVQSCIQNLQLATRACLRYLEGQKKQKRWIPASQSGDSNVIRFDAGQQQDL